MLCKNSKNSSTTVCLSCVVTLLYFLLCNVLLTQCEITDCGVQTEENLFLLQHIVYFVGFQDGMIYKDCIGTLMPSAPNHTHSDTVITSRYCFTHWETPPLVAIAGEFLENVNLQGIHIDRMISPFGRAGANAANMPFNFAIIKLSANIPFSSVAIAACLKSDLVINSNTTCYMPNIEANYLNGFGLPFKMSILHPLESCAQLGPQLKFSPLKHICAIFLISPILQLSYLL
ncbi:Antifungal protein ginkbilobin-like protein [Trichinella pseudospiralis]